MNILDEMILESQRQKLLHWNISVKQIGVDIGETGMDDVNQILPLLHRYRNITLFTLDRGFYNPKLRHPHYCIVVLRIDDSEVAKYVRQFLRVPEFKTKAKRMGHILKISPEVITYWKLNVDIEHRMLWN